MDSEVLAALLGALVGGLASGLAALGGSLIVEKMRLRKTTRIRMYELLPPIRDALSPYMRAVSNDERPEYFPGSTDELISHSAELEHISAMASRQDSQLASRIQAIVREHIAQWRSPEHWEETETGQRWWVDPHQYRTAIEKTEQAVNALEARLRKKVD